MDLHDFSDVAENYDYYLPSLPGGADASVVDFHLELAEAYGSQGIFDIACGTGAVLIPLVRRGYRVTGIDLSAAMLKVLERKLETLPPEVRHRATLLCANMTDFQPSGPASLAVIPRSGFMHLLTSVDQEQALRNIHRHLTPGGILSFNTFDPNYALITAHLKGSNPAPELRAEFTNHLGRKERLWNLTEFDPSAQLIEGRWIFEELDESGDVASRRERPLRMRYSFELELRHLLRLCGFGVLATYGSYRKEPRAYGGAIAWVAWRS